jgi:hypothetical protein
MSYHHCFQVEFGLFLISKSVNGSGEVGFNICIIPETSSAWEESRLFPSLVFEIV